MKKMNAIKRLTVLSGIIIAVFFLASCQEDGENLSTEPNESEEIDIVSNSTEASGYADEEVELSYLAQDNPSAGGRTASSWRDCVTITRDTTNRQITLDFGDGCTGPYGRTRRGKVIITFGGAFNDRLANRVIGFEEYFVNSRQFTGTIELRDINRNEEENLTATRGMTDFTVIYPDGNSLVTNGSTTREWLEGEGDGDPTTNLFELTGSYNGVSTRGRSFTHEIVEPVLVSFSCQAEGGFLRTKGIIEMTYTGKAKSRVRTVDYGDGTCDSEYTVTIDGTVHTITR